MKSKFITLKLGVKKNKTDGLLICLSKASITAAYLYNKQVCCSACNNIKT